MSEVFSGACLIVSTWSKRFGLTFFINTIVMFLTKLASRQLEPVLCFITAGEIGLFRSKLYHSPLDLRAWQEPFAPGCDAVFERQARPV